jgi:hypothetical protein
MQPTAVSAAWLIYFSLGLCTVMSKSERQHVTEAYAHVGAVATGFAALEFHLQFVLSILISGKEVSPEALLVIRSQPFGQKIELLKELVELRFPQQSDLRRLGIELGTELDALRKRRNLYVHGYWLINHQLLVATGGVRCSDTKWRFERRTRSWKIMEPIVADTVRAAPIQDKVRDLLDKNSFYIGVVTGQRDHAWISAESAYALAKRKEVVLILQRGVRFDPTLYGRDREHLAFTQIIDEAFVGLLEDLRSRSVLGLM